MSNRCATILRGPMAQAAGLLPCRMKDPRADVLLLAIGLQESRLVYRDQLEAGGRDTRPGPAMGLWQFERGGGVAGVLDHRATEHYARALCRDRGVDPVPDAVWRRLEEDDVLAAGFARLLLWTLPQALPALGDWAGAWEQYLDAWRPGKPHPHTWGGFYTEALATVQDAQA